MKKETIKADLHYHGPIGFQPYWLKIQGYEGKNLLKEIADACFKRKIGLCAITSDEDEIPINSIHDRFNWLKEKYAKTLPRGYEYDLLGKNSAIIMRHTLKDSEQLFLVNGQTVRTKEKEVTQTSGLTKKGFIDYLVVGTNQIPNHQPLADTIKRVYESGLIGIAEHALCTAHGGMGKENLEKLLPYMHAIEGHNAQLIFPVSGSFPLFGKYRRQLNKEAQSLAEGYSKPWTASSDGHRIEDVGISSIEFSVGLLNDVDEGKLLESARNIITSNNFKHNCAYQNMLGWFNWTLKLKTGYKRVEKEKIRNRGGGKLGF